MNKNLPRPLRVVNLNYAILCTLLLQILYHPCDAIQIHISVFEIAFLKLQKLFLYASLYWIHKSPTFLSPD